MEKHIIARTEASGLGFGVIGTGRSALNAAMTARERAKVGAAVKEYGDLDDVWGKVSEIIPELLGDEIEITDDWAKKNGDTLTVTIGK